MTVSVAVSITLTLLDRRFGTYTRVPAGLAAMELTPGCWPTVMTFVTAKVLGSITDTVPSPVLAT